MEEDSGGLEGDTNIVIIIIIIIIFAIVVLNMVKSEKVDSTLLLHAADAVPAVLTSL